MRPADTRSKRSLHRIMTWARDVRSMRPRFDPGPYTPHDMMPPDPPVGRLGRRHPRRRSVALPPAPALPGGHLDQMTAPATAGRVVVMIEDPTMRSTIAFYLIRAGYEVLAGTNTFELVSD